MSYTILKISTLYSDYKKRFFRDNKSESSSYESNYNLLVSDSFAEADFLTKNLRSLGVDAHEIFMDALPLQQAWASENKIRHRSSSFVLSQQIKSIRPDVLIIEDVAKFDVVLLNEIRRDNPTIRLVIGRCGLITQKFLGNARFYDLILAATPGYNDLLNDLGHVSYLMYHAFESTLVEKITPTLYAHDVVFSGSLGFAAGRHGDRLSMLNSVFDLGFRFGIMARIGKKDRLMLSLARSFPSLLGYSRFSAFIDRLIPIDLIRKYTRISSSINGPLYGAAMYNNLASSKICLNNHIGLSSDYAGNMRLFEATGVGSCLLTDHKNNMSDLFELDYEVVTYRSHAELCDRAKWLVENESHRMEIASAGQKRTLRSHSYHQRALALNSIIREHL